jgi:hypothetical protein
MHAEGIALLDRTRSIVRPGHPHRREEVKLLAEAILGSHGVLADTAAMFHRDNPGLKITTKLAYGLPADVLRKPQDKRC